MFKVLFTAVLMIVFLLQHANAATEISPGVLYQESTHLKVSSFGIEFQVPKNWQAILPEGSELLIMEPIGVVARLIISATPNSNAQTIKQVLLQNQTLDTTTELTPIGKVSFVKGLYRQSYEITGDNPQNLVASAQVKLGNNQTAFFVVMIEPKSQNLTQKVVDQLFDSTVFSSPKTEAEIQQEANSNINWDESIRGRTLRYLYTGGGQHIEKKMNLCSDGSFYYTDSGGYVSGGFSAATDLGEQGRWTISQNQLKLNWMDGSQSQFGLSRRYVARWDEWGTFINNERWFNVHNETCH